MSVSGLYYNNVILFTDQNSFVKSKPGIRFTEKMVGTYESSNNKGKQISCEFTLTVESDDVERMLNCDPSHSAKISGTVTCLALSSSPLTVSDGTCTAVVSFFKKTFVSVLYQERFRVIWGNTKNNTYSEE